MTRPVYRRQARFFRRAYETGIHGWPISGSRPEVRLYLRRVRRQCCGRPRALDLGCGEGRHAILMARLGFAVEAVDLEPLALRLAGRFARRAGCRAAIRFSVQDALDLRFADGTFDVVLDSGCFHHIVKPDWPRYRREVARVLRPPGYMILTVFSTKFRHFPGERRTRPWLCHRSHYDRFFRRADLAPSLAPQFELRRVIEQHEGLSGFWHCLFQKRNISPHGSRWRTQ
jgi:SAM-dependent methyltransferase